MRAIFQELDIQSQINIYKDETFSANYTQYPHHINENDLMYVETRIAGNSTQRAQTRSWRQSQS